MKKLNLLTVTLTAIAILTQPVYSFAAEADTVSVGDNVSDAENDESQSGYYYAGAVTANDTAYVFNDKEAYNEAYKAFMEVRVEDVNKNDEDYDESKYVEVSFVEIDEETLVDSSKDMLVSSNDFDSLKKSTEKNANETMSLADFNSSMSTHRSNIAVKKNLLTVKTEPTPEVKENDNTPTFDVTSAIVGQRANDIAWDASHERKTSFNLNIPLNTVVKLEIFYTAGCDAPNVTLVAPNVQAYSNKINTNDETVKIYSRHNNPISGYPDLVYDTLYILTTNEKMAGKWRVSYNIETNIKETIVCNCIADDNWESLAVEYKTPVMFYILWYLDEKDSDYKVDSLPSITAQEESPAANFIEESEPEEPEEKSILTPILILIVFLIIAGCGFAVYSIFKLKEEHRKQKIYSINKANNKFKKRKHKENEVLTEILGRYEDDYKDNTVNPENLNVSNKVYKEETKEEAPKESVKEPEVKKEEPQIQIPYPPYVVPVMPIIPPDKNGQNIGLNSYPNIQYIVNPASAPVVPNAKEEPKKPENTEKKQEKDDKDIPAWARDSVYDKRNKTSFF